MKKYQSFLGDKKMIKDQGLLQHEEIRRQITILPELEELIPPLQEDEFRQLEENIIKEGCREALLIWETAGSIAGENGDHSTQTTSFILIDGHNRYRICQKNGLDFKIHLVSFPSITEVRDYMIDNQLGRRNLTPEQVAYLRGKKYLAQKLSRGKYDRFSHKGQNVPYEQEVEMNSQNAGNTTVDQSGPTSRRLARQFNVSEKTIKRDAEFAEGLDKLSPALRKEVLSGKAGVKKSAIQQLAKVDINEQVPIQELKQVASAPKSGKDHPMGSSSEDKKTALKKKLSTLVNQLSKSTRQVPGLCDEIIACATDLKSLTGSTK